MSLKALICVGADLSVGAIAVFCTVIMGRLSFHGITIFLPAFGDGQFYFYPWVIPPAPAGLAVLIGLMVGTLLGAISGWLVSRVKLPPFIVTLGMWQIVLAANYLYAANETIRGQDIAAQAPFLHVLGYKLQLAGATITLGVLLMVFLVFVLAYALRSTAWGRHVYAVGDDPEAAELAGVDVHKTLMSVYMLAGFICGLADLKKAREISGVTMTKFNAPAIDMNWRNSPLLVVAALTLLVFLINFFFRRKDKETGV